MPSLLACLLLPIAVGIWQTVAADAAPLVTCGSVVKLQHANTGVNLHSHEISYGSGSGQQSVTGYTGGDDANDYWAVRGSEVDSCSQGTPLSSGSKIKLYHSSTQKWLHSHLFPSPLTTRGRSQASRKFVRRQSPKMPIGWLLKAYTFLRNLSVAVNIWSVVYLKGCYAALL
ncbi:hypothetical protein WJX79_007032 [Trebouxia sp. C0005]